MADTEVQQTDAVEDDGKKGKRERKSKPPKPQRERRPMNLKAAAGKLPALVFGVLGLLLFGGGLLTHNVLLLGGGTAAIAAGLLAFVLPVETHKFGFVQALGPLFAVWLIGLIGLFQIVKW